MVWILFHWNESKINRKDVCVCVFFTLRFADFGLLAHQEYRSKSKKKYHFFSKHNTRWWWWCRGWCNRTKNLDPFHNICGLIRDLSVCVYLSAVDLFSFHRCLTCVSFIYSMHKTTWRKIKSNNWFWVFAWQASKNSLWLTLMCVQNGIENRKENTEKAYTYTRRGAVAATGEEEARK